MTTTTDDTSNPEHGRAAGAVAALYAGLLLSAAAMVAPYVDRATGHVLADHIRHGYPTYTPDRVDSAVTVWLGILTVTGVLGLASWAGSIWAVKAGKGWARLTATGLFLAGTGLASTLLLTKDSSGEVGLAPLLGWIGMLPSTVGLVAVAMLWADPPARSART